MKECGVCGAQVADDLQFCPTCGSEIRQDSELVDESPEQEHPHTPTSRNNFCANCGAELSEGAKFCAECGTPVGQSTSDGPRHGAPYGPQQSVGRSDTTSDDRTMATLCHISTFAGFFFPFGNIIAPLVIWLMQKDKSPYVDFHGKEAINFQISLFIYGLVGGIIGFILILVVVGIFLLLALIPGLFIFWIVAVIVAAVKANQGEWWEYPLSIRILK